MTTNPALYLDCMAENYFHKLIMSQLVKKFPTCFDTLRLVITCQQESAFGNYPVSTEASAQCHHIYLTFTLILYIHLHLGHPKRPTFTG
jgi:hypothetical protein